MTKAKEFSAAANWVSARGHSNFTEALCGQPATRCERNAMPNIVFLTGPFDPKSIVENNKKFVDKGTEFRFYDDKQMTQSAYDISKQLEAVGVHGAWDAYKSLRPMAFKADLWRYMVLWQHGGAYLDGKIKLRSHISHWANFTSPKLSVCRDKMITYWNAMMAAPRQSEDLKLVIEHVIENVQKQMYYTDEPWRARAAVGNPGKIAENYGGNLFEFAHSMGGLMITGPGALTEALNINHRIPRSDCELTGDRQMIPGRIGGYEIKLTRGQGRLRHAVLGDVAAEVDETIHQETHTRSPEPGYQDLVHAKRVYCGPLDVKCRVGDWVEPREHPAEPDVAAQPDVATNSDESSADAVITIGTNVPSRSLDRAPLMRPYEPKAGQDFWSAVV